MTARTRASWPPHYPYVARIRIGQLVRPDGKTVLTENAGADEGGYPLYWIPGPRDGQGPIQGPYYGRWRYQDEQRWRVTLYCPPGAWSPRYADPTGEGRFLPFDPSQDMLERSAEARALETPE